MRAEWLKEVKYIVTEGNYTSDGQHAIVHRCQIIILYTWKLYNVINHGYPNKLKKTTEAIQKADMKL